MRIKFVLKKWRLKSLTLRKNILLPFGEGIFMAVSNDFLFNYLSSSKLKLYCHDRIPLIPISYFYGKRLFYQIFMKSIIFFRIFHDF